MQNLRSVANIMLSALMFALAGVIVKYVSSDMDIFSLVFWRNIFSFICVIITGFFSG